MESKQLAYPWPFNLLQDYFLDLQERVVRIEKCLVREHWDILGGIRDAVTGMFSVIRAWIDSGVSVIRAWINSAIENLKFWLSPLIDSIKSFIQSLMSSLGSTLSSIWSKLTQGIEWITRTMADWFSRAWDFISSKVNWLWQVISSSISNLGNLVKSGMESLGKTMGDLTSNLWKNVTNSLGSLWQNISKGFEWLLSQVSKSFDWAIKAIVDPLLEWFKGITSWLGQALANAFSFLLGAMKEIAGKLWEMAIGFSTWLAEKVMGFFTDIVNRVREFFLPASPPKELTEAIIGLLEDFRKDLEQSIASIYHSSPSPEEVAGVVLKVAGTAIAISTTGEVMGAVADSAHPAKHLQIRDIIKGIFAYFGIERLIKTPLNVPYEIALLRPFTHEMEKRFRTNIPTIDEAKHMLWRGIISLDEFKDVIAKHGYGGNFEKGFVELTKSLPSMSDLITMMVREVFDPDRFKELVQEFPEAIVQYGQMHGFTREWLERYWAMHWVLVPITQLYEMYHRGIIDYKTLERFVKYHDIEPMCRPWVIELSWGLPERIDMRWMYEWGVLLTYEEVFGRKVEPFPELPDMTYEEKALATWLIADGVHPKVAPHVARAWVRNLLREEIMKVFAALVKRMRLGLMTKEELDKELDKLGIPKHRREYYVRAAEIELENEVAEKQIEAILEAYRKGIMDKTTAISRLDQIIKVTERRDALIKLTEARMRIEKEIKKRETHFTMAQIGDFFRRGLIDESKARELWAKLGYSDWEIDLLVARYAPIAT